MDNWFKTTEYPDAASQFASMEASIGLKPNQGTVLERLAAFKASPACGSWKAKSFIEALEKRAKRSDFASFKTSMNNSSKSRGSDQGVLIVGAGIAGLRAAIELKLMGWSRVVVLDQRKEWTRNNVLELWPFQVNDLIGLGIKNAWGGFGVGSPIMVAIRTLQLALARAAMVLGADIRTGITFTGWKKNPTGSGWVANTEPALADSFNFHYLLGAEGVESVVGKLAKVERRPFKPSNIVGITANFKVMGSKEEKLLNKGTFHPLNMEHYMKVFNQLTKDTGLEFMENFRYFLGETHYIVFATKPDQLIKIGVCKAAKPDVPSLLSRDNIDREKLENCARACLPTIGLPADHPWALNGRGNKDVAIFDFSTKLKAVSPSLVSDDGLFIAVIGDSAVTPFWPLGTGGNRGVYSAMDTSFFMSQLAALPADKPLSASDPKVASILATHTATFNIMHEHFPDKTNANNPVNIKDMATDPVTRYPKYKTRVKSAATTSSSRRSRSSSRSPKGKKRSSSSSRRRKSKD